MHVLQCVAHRKGRKWNEWEIVFNGMTLFSIHTLSTPEMWAWLQKEMLAE